VKTQQPIPPDQEHRVLKFRPRTSAHPPGQRDVDAHAVSGQASGRQVSKRQASGGEILSVQAQPKYPPPKYSRPRDSGQEQDDLARYERSREEPDDFHQRMLANVAAFAFTVALTAVGLWLAISIADLRKTQDCVLMGRRDCARILVPHF
jgi:hypothetical protein